MGLPTRNTYEPEQAAEFLEISMDELEELKQKRALVLRCHRNRKFFLGGELDYIKPTVHKRLQEMAKHRKTKHLRQNA